MTRYLIVGGGMTGAAAIEGVRERDADGAITVLTDEAVGPYDRPPLSKGLWKGQPRDSVWRSLPDGVDLRLGVRATAIDPRGHAVTDEAGQSYAYDRLLLATGGTPRRLAHDSARVVYFRTIADYDRLRALADTASRFVVIGGGFIGSELAASLAASHKKVSLVVRERHIGARLFPEELAAFLDRFYREHGVEVLTGEGVAAIGEAGAEATVVTTSGRRLLADGVVAGLGILPNAGLAAAAGLRVGDGIAVDEHLRAGAPDIFAAGDVARFLSPALGHDLRCEHEDNANTMGRIAGHNMAGAMEPYHHLPFFYSDIFDAGYEAVGDIDPRLETLSDWVEPFGKGVIYYLKGERVRGVLLWNVWGAVETARDMIRHEVVSDRDTLLERIGAHE